MWAFPEESPADPTSALLVSGERSLAAEFPPQAIGRDVLRTLGSGERTFTNIARAAGGISHSTLSRAIDMLIEKRVVAGVAADVGLGRGRVRWCRNGVQAARSWARAVWSW